MNRLEAKLIVESHVRENYPGCSIIEDYSEEFASGFVFYFQSKKFLESSGFGDMYVGQGPIIVCKETGGVFETGAAYSAEHYVDAFESCGDPLGEPTDTIVIDGWIDGASAVKAIKCIRQATGLGLANVKSKVDQVLGGDDVVIKLSSIDVVDSTISTLAGIGFQSSQLWGNQC